MGDEQTTERTLEAMDYNIRVKQQFIDSLLREIVDLQEENKRLKGEVSYLEHLRETALIN